MLQLKGEIRHFWCKTGGTPLYFLYGLKVMNLIGEISESIHIIQNLQSLINVRDFLIRKTQIVKSKRKIVTAILIRSQM